MTRRYRGRGVSGKHCWDGAYASVLPEDYVAVDCETTGLSWEQDELLELAAVRVRGGRLTERFSQLVQPTRLLDPYIQQLTGITPDMLTGQPAIGQVLPKLLGFLGDDVVVGHNVRFDLDFLAHAAEALGLTLPTRLWLDTGRLTRLVLDDVKDYRLGTVAEYLELRPEHAHRALSDAETCALVLETLRPAVRERGIDITRVPNNRFAPGPRANRVHARCTVFDENGPLYGRTCVITGSIDGMSREEAMQAIADAGGRNADSVTCHTDILVAGSGDPNSGKRRRAESCIRRGTGLRIISAEEFLSWLS